MSHADFGGHVRGALVDRALTQCLKYDATSAVKYHRADDARAHAHETSLLGGRGPAAGRHGRPRPRGFLVPRNGTRSRFVVLLLALTLVGEWFSVEISDGQLSASLVAIVLAMGLLGPAPAAAFGIAAVSAHVGC